MACVLQSFFRASLPDRLEQFLRGLEDKSKQKEELIANTCLSWAFLELNSAPFDRRRDQMEKLRHVLLQLEPKKFCAEQQHDAHEFVVFLLERIKEETTKLLVPRPLTDTEDNIVHSLFTFKIRIDLYCKPCNETDERFETGSHMILRPPDTEENQASINELMHAELSNYGGDYTCPTCSAKFEKTRQWFCKYPSYLILMLQRYSFDEQTRRPSKIETSVHVNRELFLLPSLQKETDTEEEDQNAIETSSPVRISRSRHVRSIENFPHEISAIPGPSGIVEDEDGDVSIIKEKTIEKKTFPYKPVTNQWRKRVCDQLQLDPVPLQENMYADYECAGQTSECRTNCAPEVFGEVDSDGNCLFRALAHLITGGNEEQHMELRTKICSFMKSHRTSFSRSFAKTEEEFDHHVQTMEKRSTGGTKSELFACATMLQTPISNYLDGRWVPYMPCFPLEDDASPVTYSSVNRTTIDSYDHVMYLLNQCEHYYPVLSVPERKYYELKSVMTHHGESANGGHYTAFLRAEKNARGRQWVQCNDSTVVPVSEIEAMDECSKSGYILFYESSTETINLPSIKRRRRPERAEEAKKKESATAKKTLEMSENVPTPSTITASKLKPEVVKNFGHPLPKKYETLLHLFEEMEKIVSIKHGRDMRIAFDSVVKNVMKNTKITFNETNLAQIMGVFSQAYDLHWEKPKRKLELILQPNLKSDLDQYLKEEALEWLKAKQSSPVKSIFSSQQSLFSPTKQLTSPKRNDRDNIHKTPTKSVPDVFVSPRKLQKTPTRKELEAKDQPQSLAQDGFRIVTPLLISPTKRTNLDYIKKSTPQRRPVRSLCLEANQLLHPEFELDGILEIKPGKIPQMPQADASLRIKAAKEQNDPTIDKRIAALQFLKQSMVEVICSHLRRSKVGAMSLPMVRERVIKSCGPMDKDKFMDYIEVLCCVAPMYCSKESGLADSRLKIANVRTDSKIYVKIAKCIEDELTRMSMRKNIKTEARFGTLNDYFSVLERRLDEDTNDHLPTLSGDFFTYADRDDHYWSGYFTSRPFYKHMDRILQHYLRSADILFTLASAYSNNKASTEKFSAATQMYDHLVEARRALSLFQHHDGVTGTAKRDVVVDYGHKMLAAIKNCKSIIAKAAEYLMNFPPSREEGLKVDEFHYVDHLPYKIVTEDGSSIVVFNSLAYPREEVTCIHVNSGKSRISRAGSEDHKNDVPQQIGPVFHTTPGGRLSIYKEKFELCFMATLPALGFTRYDIFEAEETAHRVKIHASDSSLTSPFFEVIEMDTDAEVTIKNNHLKANFDPKSGYLKSVTNKAKPDPAEFSIDMSFVHYGARPHNTCRPQSWPVMCCSCLPYRLSFSSDLCFIGPSNAKRRKDLYSSEGDADKQKNNKNVLSAPPPPGSQHGVPNDKNMDEAKRYKGNKVEVVFDSKNRMRTTATLSTDTSGKYVCPAMNFSHVTTKSDVQMLNVYDILPFDNLDGGVWKQGWKIDYDKKTILKEKRLEVGIVPHSHNDPAALVLHRFGVDCRSDTPLRTDCRTTLGEVRLRSIFEPTAKSFTETSLTLLHPTNNTMESVTLDPMEVRTLKVAY
ncbi:ubiquitin carboxyl-terminal hydrolase domain-containing protein [Ditylenchus destructor]|nr:ubiquitin carboxyl-terminal hydrolase domain-containing protein [Ditylenchus destructor]